MLTALAQFVHRRMLAPPQPGLAGKLGRRVWHRLQRWILARRDPIITASVFGDDLRMPLSHRLPFNLVDFRYYGTNLRRLAEAVQGKYPDLCAIDVGANVGDSVALLRSGLAFPILCIEGNPTFYSLLVANMKRYRDVTLEQTYLGEATAEIKAQVSEEHGTSYLSYGSQNEVTIRIETLSEVLNRHAQFQQAKLLKVDTDGFDGKVIRGASRYLEAARPVIFFEYDPLLLSKQQDNGLGIFSYLARLGYQGILVYDSIGYYLLSTTAGDVDLLQDLHRYFYNRAQNQAGNNFCDICIFHEQDQDLFQSLRQQEQHFFRTP